MPGPWPRRACAAVPWLWCSVLSSSAAPWPYPGLCVHSNSSGRPSRITALSVSPPSFSLLPVLPPQLSPSTKPASASVQFANPSWRSLTLPTQTPWRQGPSPLCPAAVSPSPQLPLMAHCPSPQRWSPVCFIPTPFSSLPVAQTSETETLLCSGPGDQTQSRQPIAAAGSHLWVCCTDGP